MINGPNIYKGAEGMLKFSSKWRPLVGVTSTRVSSAVGAFSSPHLFETPATIVSVTCVNCKQIKLIKYLHPHDFYFCRLRYQ